jgi:uracil phosphoribosyltransferase
MDPAPARLTIVDHPLVQHKVTLLRDQRTPTALFRDLVREISTLLVPDATRDLPWGSVEVDTPLERTFGVRLDGPCVVVPILRAGLGMAEAFLDLLPFARVGHIGLARNEETLEPHRYLFRLPPDAAAGVVLLVDPMLATGGSAVEALRLLKASGVGSIRLVCIVAAPEGVQAVHRAHPDVPIVTAALDRALDGAGYIRPGLGDAGDRLFGTT